MAQAPRYFQQPVGTTGPDGREGPQGTPPGSLPPWRLYIMGDHPNAIPGETYSDPSVGDGWLAMGDAYLTADEGDLRYEPIGSGSGVSPYQLKDEKGVANGYAGLGSDGKVPLAQLPPLGDGGDSGGGGDTTGAWFAGRHWYAGGTSLTIQGFYTAPLAALSGMILHNLGVSSATLCAQGGAGVYASMITMGSDAEVVTLETTNDWRKSMTLGSMADAEDHTVSFYGALKSITAWVLTNRPAARFFLMTNYPDALNEPGSWGNFKIPNNLGLFQWEYDVAVRDVAAQYGVPVIEAAGESGINYYTAQWYTSDGLHLNTHGGQRYAEYVWSKMRSLDWGTARPTPPAGIVTVPASGVVISEGTAIAVAPGGTSPLTAVVSPPNATNKTVAWSSSNQAVATVAANGVVTGVAAGSATITVTTSDGGYTDTIAVTVASAAVSSVDLQPPTATITNPPATTQLTWTVLPSNAGNKAVTFTSSNPAVATVNTVGLVSGLAAGSTTITITTADGGKTDTCVVTVAVISVTGVDVTPPAVTTYVGQTAQLTAAVIPANAGNKSLSWQSSDNAKATVNSSGLVTGVALGPATITATTTQGGFTDTSAVTVSPAPEWALNPQTVFRGIGISNISANGSNPTYLATLEGVTYGSLLINTPGHNAIEFTMKTGQALQVTIGSETGVTEAAVGSFVNFGDNDAVAVNWDTFNIITAGVHGTGGAVTPAATTPGGIGAGKVFRIGRVGTRVKIVRVDPGPVLVDIWDGDLAVNFPGDASKYAVVNLGLMGRGYAESIYALPINCKTGTWTPP